MIIEDCNDAFPGCPLDHVQSHQLLGDTTCLCMHTRTLRACLNVEEGLYAKKKPCCSHSAHKMSLGVLWNGGVLPRTCDISSQNLSPTLISPEVEPETLPLSPLMGLQFELNSKVCSLALLCPSPCRGAECTQRCVVQAAHPTFRGTAVAVIPPRLCLCGFLMMVIYFSCLTERL